MSNSEINSKLADSIVGKEIEKLTENTIETVIDSLIDEGVIKEIPVVGTILSTYKLGMGIREKFFLKKILRFLFRLNDIPEEERKRFIEDLNNNSEYKDKVIEKTLILIDRLDDLEKSELVGNLFKACIKRNLDVETFLRLSFIVDRSYISDLLELYNYNLSSNDKNYKSKFKWDINSDVVSKNLTSLGVLESHLREHPYGSSENITGKLYNDYEISDLGILL